ncbi:MAG: PAS domain-containing sensor histidine kinase [Bdellovibrionaceae bacterium]|nr:PAS domain-containing sensor histidine kinase [Pseudobdellovibrionaceae bacterium]
MSVSNVPISRKWQVESVRVLLYIFSLIVLIFFYFWQAPFVSWALLGPSFLVLGMGLGIHFFLFFKIDSMSDESATLLTTFIVDSFFISLYVYFSSGSVSLFLLLHVINIILGSFIFKGKGAVILALVTSFNYSWVQVLGPEFKTIASLITLTINNLAFFGVAGLAGYLSEKLFQTETELKVKEGQLRSLEDLYELIIEKSPVALLTLDKDSRIVQMNTKALMLFPLIKSEGRLTEFFPPLGAVWSQIISLDGQDEFAREIDFKNEIEDSIFKILAKPIAKAEGLFLLVIEDLSQMRKMEYHLKQSEKLAAIGGLAAGVAHEIRNPLAGISGSVELLSQQTQGEDDRKLMKIILKEIDRLNNLITEFLEYAKPAKNPTEPSDLNLIIRDVLGNVAQNAQLRKDVKLRVDLESEAMIKGFSDKLKQAFLNIVINAYQAMEKSPQAELDISLKKIDRFWNLKIKDSGLGMNEQTLKRLFEPFYTTKSKGTGLGLAVTHKILESHHAVINVRSQLGQGTEFEFNFPCLE